MKYNKSKFGLKWVMAGLVFLAACKKDDPYDQVPPPNDVPVGTINLGTAMSADFFGQVTDESGTPVQGASITVGSKTTITDANGIFFVENASVKEKLAYVTAEKNGFFLGSRSLIPDGNNINNVKIQMLKMDLSGTTNSGEIKTISDSDVSVTLEGKYVDESGSLYSGSVSVYIKSLPATAAETQNQMPGMLYAQDASGEDGALETFGMIAVELRGAAGEELQIAGGSKATIEIPVASSQLSSAPASIPLWYFDEVNGYWVEDGQATLQGDKYIGAVTHFSFWNCDDFFDDCQFHGTVVDVNGNPMPNVSVTINTNSANTTGVTGSSGEFFTYLPANQTITFTIVDQCGNTILSQVAGPFAANSVNSVTLTVTNIQSSVHVTGNVNDCSLNPVTNGLVEINDGSQTHVFSITNGIVDITFSTCSAPADVDIVVTDFSTLQEGTMNNVPVVSGAANFGTINACNSLSEYISWTVDGSNSVHVTNLNCNEYPDTLGGGTTIVVYSQNGNGYVSLQGSADAVGTYGLVQDIYTATGFNMYSGNHPSVDFATPPSVTVQVTNYPAVMGDYFDATLSGTYYDSSSNPHTVNIDIHVQRDN